MKLIVGLGNPGQSYEDTRHNFGFKVIDQLAKEYNLSFSDDKKLGAKIAKGQIDDQQVILLKPQTYMNLSGDPLNKCMQYYKVDKSSLLVLHDEVNLEFDEIRLKPKGGSGGHNGLKHIQAYIGDEYSRLRLGVGQPKHHEDLADYVLKKFSNAELEKLNFTIDDSIQIIKIWLNLGVESAMKEANTKKS